MSNKLFKVDFLIVGAQKSGTTAFDQYLRAHKKINMASRKEVHFFDNEINFNNELNYDNYHQYFEPNLDKIYGECTPIYMYWNDAVRRIYEYNPRMKIIAILRNPVERAYSHWNMEIDRNAESLDFRSAIESESASCQEALPLQHRVYSYIDRGFYSEQIRRIWRFFPPSQTLFIKHDDLKNNLSSTLNAVSDFLEIDKFTNIHFQDTHSRQYQLPLSGEVRTYLKQIYLYEIAQLESMLNWDCSDWKI